MWIGVVSLFPDMFSTAQVGGVVGRALNNDLFTLRCANPRDFTQDKHRTVDDKPYGGGAGMVMMAQPLADAVEDLKQQAAVDGVMDLPVIMLTPAGETFTQPRALEISRRAGLILVCGRYEGVDERFLHSVVDARWSVGDFVLSGGELPALVVVDAVARQLPGVLGNSRSNLDESHLDGTLEYPQYTRPEKTLNLSVPAELLSGDHAGIKSYRRREALVATFESRPDLLTGRVFDETDRLLLKDYFADHPG